MDETRSRSVALSAEIDQAVEKAVAAGEFATADEVIEGALRDWKERRENSGYTIAELRAEIRKGIDSQPGEFESFEDIRAEAHRRFARRSSGL